MGQQTITGLGRNAQQQALKRAPSATPHGQTSRTLALAVLGVVYGDIGTSPIYALRQCFEGVSPVTVSAPNVLGVLSLIFWTLILVISIKYMTFVLRADNRGEGGIFALLALLTPEQGRGHRLRSMLLLLGIAGAAMLYGGTMITPAISVLSAVEGLQVAAPGLHSYVIPITVVILFLLFMVQRYGTAKLGAVFGSLMLLWFLVLAALGIRGIVAAPEVLLAISPWYAVQFFLNNGFHGYLIMFAVFLVSTGGEALDADLGHFGRTPIRKVWFMVVLPALQQLVRHTGVLYQQLVSVTVIIEQVSKVSSDERLELTQLEQGFYRVIMHYGFMQGPNVPSDLANCAALGLKVNLDQIHYIIGQVDMLAGRKQHGMAHWRDRLFVWMARNTEDVTASYHIPAAQAMAVGLQIGI